MKRTILLILALFFFCNVTVIAEETKVITNVLLTQTQSSQSSKGSKDRHRAPARQNDVECYYLDGNLHINFEFPEGNAILNIYDMSGTKCLQQPFSTTMPFIYNIGDVTEPIKIEIETSINIYEGWLII